MPVSTKKQEPPNTFRRAEDLHVFASPWNGALSYARGRRQLPKAQHKHRRNAKVYRPRARERPARNSLPPRFSTIQP